MTHSAPSGDPVPDPGVRSAGTASGPGPRTDPSVRLLLFAGARQAAGTREITVAAGRVDAVLSQARERFGEAFGAVLDRSRIWVNGEPAEPSTPLAPGDEVAVLPPVSGGAGRCR